MKAETQMPPPRPKIRRPYEPPRIETEETFERQALLGCGKTSGAVCAAKGGTKNS